MAASATAAATSLLTSVFFALPGAGAGVVSSLLRFHSLFFAALFLEIQNKDFGFSLKRLIILLLLYIGFPILLIWNHIGFGLDDWLYPEWRQCGVHKPCFIVGNARSGTTWLHRLIVTSMEDKFTTFKTWEIIFAPSVTWKRLFLTLYWLDSSFFGSIGFHLLCQVEEFVLPASQLHEIGLQLAEEDEWLMIHISFAQLMCFFFPCAGVVLDKLIMFDLPPNDDANKLSVAHRELMFSFYKECVQRHIYARYELDGIPSRNVVFVSKNPAFTLRIESLYKKFPDARVVCLLRDPKESVPSMVSYIAKVYHAFSAPRIVYPNARDLLSYCITHYQYPLVQLNEAKHPVNQWAFVKYSHLKNDLQATLLQLLVRLEIIDASVLRPGSKSGGKRLGNSGDLKARLAVEQNLTKKFKSTHKHSVESCCGMDEAELKQILHEVYEKHNFE